MLGSAMDRMDSNGDMGVDGLSKNPWSRDVSASRGVGDANYSRLCCKVVKWAGLGEFLGYRGNARHDWYLPVFLPLRGRIHKGDSIVLPFPFWEALTHCRSRENS